MNAFVEEQKMAESSGDVAPCSWIKEMNKYIAVASQEKQTILSSFEKLALALH